MATNKNQNQGSGSGSKPQSQQYPYYPNNPYNSYYSPQMQGQPGYVQGVQQGAPQGMPQGMPQGQQQGGQQFPGMPGGQQAGQNIPGMLPTEQSYIENILRLNLGKEATVYMTFENNTQWNAKVFKGIIEAAGRDHIILSDPQTGKRYLLLMIYLDYITFDEELNYSYPYGVGSGQMATYSPR
ncbi:spore coat protein GerQ [Thalassobacillus pellis]|uniref:spore coat protein GerQ n=1 Tax=Thalassobacillus pellis TaxID=748008 RepID=UPI001EF99339|nr:spore coat protein GerQ [Thalassobacillus pellis]MBM7551823.1 spore germination protein Q [Thalassobacillus pellis]